MANPHAGPPLSPDHLAPHSRRSLRRTERAVDAANASTNALAGYPPTYPLQPDLPRYGPDPLGLGILRATERKVLDCVPTRGIGATGEPEAGEANPERKAPCAVIAVLGCKIELPHPNLGTAARAAASVRAKTTRSTPRIVFRMCQQVYGPAVVGALRHVAQLRVARRSES